jgi:chaperonin GroES
VAARTLVAVPESKLEIQMLHDRVMVRLVGEDGERRSSGGILIPATAQMAKRLSWGEVYGIGNHVRTIQVGDRVLFNPEDQYEVEVRGQTFLIVRERDLQAVASERTEHGTGLYL